MLSRLLRFFFCLALNNRRAIYVAFAVLVPISLVLSTRLTVTTSQQALLKADHPVQVAYRRFVQEFGTSDALVAVVWTDRQENIELRPVVDDLAKEFQAKSKLVRNVFHRVDLTPMIQKAPFYFPLKDLRRGAAFLEKHREALHVLDAPLTVETALFSLSEGLKNGLSAGVGPGEAKLLLEGFSGGIKAWTDFVKNPQLKRENLADLALQKLAETDGRVSQGGYLTSRDGKMFFLFVQPLNVGDDAKILRPFLKEMRLSADRVLASYPKLSGKAFVGFTGSPAHVLTEADTVFDDVFHGVIGALVLMVGIIFVGFRTVKKTVCLFIPLLCGMALSLGAITLTVGRLNLISAAFFAVMFGMGMDFGIYLVRRTEEEIGVGKSLEEAVEIAVVKTGRGVFVGGLTTCAAFFGTSLTEFSGFSELGVTAGIGIFICLASVFFLTPSLMLSLGVAPRKADTVGVEKRLESRHASVALRIVAVAVVVAAVVSCFAAGQNHFDYDALKLLPRDSQSTALQWRMQEESNFSANGAVVVADSVAEIRRVAEKLRMSSQVSRVESLADLIPENLSEKHRELQRIRRVFLEDSRRFREEIRLEKHEQNHNVTDNIFRSENSEKSKQTVGLKFDEKSPADARFDENFGNLSGAKSSNEAGNLEGKTENLEHRLNEILDGVEGISEGLADAQEVAFSAGLSDLSVALGHALDSVEDLAVTLKKVPAEQALERTDYFWSWVSEGVKKGISLVDDWTSESPISESDFAPEFLARFKSDSGKYVAYVFPKSLVWDVDALDKFMAAIRQVTPNVTGFAATHQVFSRMVPKSFAQSMAFAFVALVLMLFLDLRNFRVVAFALMPMLLGLLLLQGVLRLLGVDHNYASVAAYPVLLGYGSDYGVNVVHRWLERPRATAFVTAFTVGKGVILSAATSAAGLFSIVFARHKGVADFGTVLLVGIAMCLLTAVVFLPVFIDLFRPTAQENPTNSTPNR